MFDYISGWIVSAHKVGVGVGTVHRGVQPGRLAFVFSLSPSWLRQLFLLSNSVLFYLISCGWQNVAVHVCFPTVTQSKPSIMHVCIAKVMMRQNRPIMLLFKSSVAESGPFLIISSR